MRKTLALGKAVFRVISARESMKDLGPKDSRILIPFRMELLSNFGSEGDDECFIYETYVSENPLKNIMLKYENDVNIFLRHLTSLSGALIRVLTFIYHPCV